MSTITLTDDYKAGQQARSIPGAYWSRDEKAWMMADPTPRSAAVALKLFPRLAEANPQLTELRASLGQDLRPIDNAVEYDCPIDSPSARKVLAGEGHEMYQFQAVDLGYAAAIMREHGAAYLGWERGLGKSLGACALAEDLEAKRILIVCPNTAKRSVWEPELRRFCPWLNEVVVLRNTKSQREKDLGYTQQLIQQGLPFALVVHYEALAIIETAPGWGKLCTWDLVVADEAHRIANPKTKMARALKKVPTKYKLALSGTIIGNHAEELFSPLQWLFPKSYRSKWRDWNDRFLDYVDSGYSRVCVGVRIDMLEALRQELGVFLVYRRKEDELDLPAKTEQTLLVDLSPSQRKAYVELQETCFAQLSDGTTIKASDGLVLLTRLRQVATGLDLVSGLLADSTKQDLAVELIEDAPDDAFVVFSWYKSAARALAKRLEAGGVPCFCVDGDVKPDTRADYISRFQAGEGRVFIGTIATLGESVTLTRASNAVFLDRSWNPGHNTQAQDRIYRIGQDKPVTITHIVARDTVDELVVSPVIADKAALRNLIMGGN